MNTPTLFDGDTIPMIGTTFGIDSARTRRSDPVQSHLAADSNNVRDSRAVVLAAFHERKYFADHELVEFLAGTKYTPQRIRTARSELAESGLIELVGRFIGDKFYPDTTTTDTGRQARIWTLRKDAA